MTALPDDHRQTGDAGPAADVPAAAAIARLDATGTRQRVDELAEVLVDCVDGGVAGTDVVRPAPQENQRHRADVVKLLVHRRARGRGVATALMAEAERAATELGRSLLVLDTETGSPAEHLYRRLGWTALGAIPGYALSADGRPSAATFFWKQVPGA